MSIYSVFLCPIIGFSECGLPGDVDLALKIIHACRLPGGSIWLLFY